MSTTNYENNLFLCGICAKSITTSHYMSGTLVCMAEPHSTPRERVWDMAIEQFVAPHRGVRTNYSAVFSHMKYVINR